MFSAVDKSLPTAENMRSRGIRRVEYLYSTSSYKEKQANTLKIFII
jgi:hypothetical protein